MKRLFLLGFILTSLSFPSCSSSNTDESANLKPSNLSVTEAKVGAASNLPHGDGSGTVNFTILASDATYFKVSINNEVLQFTENTFSYTFTEKGTKDYAIIVAAYNSNGNTSITFSIKVFVEGNAQLVWSDEFNTNGAPNTSNWGYDLSNGRWPDNNELQRYTNNVQNVVVENGVLKITAKADGTGYTSARLKSQGLQAFKYGKIEVRAKLPASQGTWPAIWMLGSNFGSVGWPQCGEMDIMEQTGWDKNKVLGTFHWQDAASNSYAHFGKETSATSSTTDFHLYTLEWRADVIQMLYDDVPYVTLTNNTNLPFNANFFIILNVAMGGNLGGTVNPNFTQDTMEVDYVRVYQ